MTVYSFVKKGILLFIFCPLYSYGQKNGPYAGEIRKAGIAIKNAQEMAYNYSMLSEYPDGETDHLTGEVYVDEKGKLLYNQNDAFSMLYTDKWYYKADHRKKTVTIVNLVKHLNKDYKEGIEHDIFENSTANIYFDSVILKYGSVKKLKKNEDSVEMELSFPKSYPVKTLDIFYNDKNKLLTAYRIQIFQPWLGAEFGKNKGTKQIIACTNYRKIENNKDYSTGNFFIIKRNKVVLKKYKDYKVFTSI